MRLWGLERRAAERLEAGSDGAVARGLGRAWAWRSEARRRWGWAPPGISLIGVEGATLGGSWKTPVSMAAAEGLAARGLRVALLAHGHGGRLRAPREVRKDDDPAEVGDEALLAARRLAGAGVVVVAGPRAEALRALEGRASVVVADALAVDGGPGREALLALDGRQPWGAGACPPAGDLRASPGYLRACATEVVTVDEEGGEGQAPGGWRATATLWAGGLRGARVAAVTAVARPGRFLRALGRRGVEVVAAVALPDHGGRGAGAWAEARLGEQKRATGGDFDLVVCTDKCALWLPPRLLGRPVVAVGLGLTLPPGLVGALHERVAAARGVRFCGPGC